MSADNLLEKVKQLREITGVGFKDCKNAIDETKGDIDKAVEFLRKKGIAKASKRMGKTAAEGLICISQKENDFAITEINSETDFVAKNKEFINFAKEVSDISLKNSGAMEVILNSKMKNDKKVEENLVLLVAKIGEKITLRRSTHIGGDKSFNFSYMHSLLENNVGKLGVLISLETNKKRNEIEDLGKKLAMQIAASSPLSIDKTDLDEKVLKKETEIIKEELKNSGKDPKIIDKIANGKINKFIMDNTLLNQEWIMEPKRKVKEVIKEIAGKDKIEIKNFVRFKVGEKI